MDFTVYLKLVHENRADRIVLMHCGSALFLLFRFWKDKYEKTAPVSIVLSTNTIREIMINMFLI